eukprot:m.986930 g.986930  ORF g.986930 m.986930 type:complete len:102 (+) comp23990_c0_seq30:2500-2805(+)
MSWFAGNRHWVICTNAGVAGETAIRTALAAVLHETKESAVAVSGLLRKVLSHIAPALFADATFLQNDNEWEWCFAPSPKEVQLLQVRSNSADAFRHVSERS